MYGTSKPTKESHMTSPHHPQPPHYSSTSSHVTPNLQDLPDSLVHFSIDHASLQKLMLLTYSAGTDLATYITKLITDAYIDYLILTDSDPASDHPPLHSPPPNNPTT